MISNSLGMSRSFSSFTTLFLLVLIPVTCKAKINHHYCHSSCGDELNISYPFRLKSDPKSCGFLKFELACKNNRTILQLHSAIYYVEEINYNLSLIRVVDASLQKDDCSFLPLHSLTHRNFSSRDMYWLSHRNRPISFIYCAAGQNFTPYADTEFCSKNHSSNLLLTSSQQRKFVVNNPIRVSDMEDSCSISMVVWVSSHGLKTRNTSFQYMSGCFMVLSFHDFLCLFYSTTIGILYRGSFLIGWIVAARNLLAIPFVLIFLIYKWRRRNLSMYAAIEEFIQTHNNLMPIRYSYSNIKKMTKGFSEKLGEGGYGSVYKGKLRSGHLVAGSKRALVYDFMPNGSLDKYIFPQQEDRISLSYRKMYAISLGVAHGIEYLHRGCDIQILHFDIKPHNILLDQNFTPKISDFGLAKSYPTDHNTVSLTAARGTMGYMAPELFYKNIGGVSYKADVYSYGMLLMEMASRRKNLNVFAEILSQIYFPTWVYDQLTEGKDIEMEDTSEEEQKLAKKMITVALWCIQLKPSDRPSMNKVVEMLEENVELLQMPPKPFLTPREVPAENDGNTTNPTEISINIR
ncbi:hypothetical protein AAG906_012021 [Vitis piasezkii]